jgi:diaminopimelate epimerase
MKLVFTKMQGAGNDFIVIDALRSPFVLDAGRIRQLADRHFGIGFDQLLVVEPPTHAGRAAGADFRYRIFNSDGGEVEQCGNGARCFVKFVHDRSLAPGLGAGRAIAVETLGGLIRPRLEDDGEVSVDMGAPVLADPLVQIVVIEGAPLALAILSMGNPHAVQRVSDVDAAPVSQQGPAIERHERFPDRVNAGYMQVIDRHRIALRVYERGAGETLACGTGACAAVVAGIVQGWIESPVEVRTRGGSLTIAWPGGDNAVSMKGPARSVFEGVVEI